MTDTVTLNIEGQRIKVGREFLELSPEQQNATVEEIAQSLGAKPSGKYPLMSQLNAGIADTAGGLADLLNPFDQPHALNPFPQGTGSARDAVVSGMETIGVEVAQDDPQTVAESFFRGTGQAAGAAPVAGVAGRVLSQAGGMAGQLSDDVARSLSTPGGVAAEALAGGIGGAAAESAEQAGAPEWVQDTAAIVAPMSIPAAAAAASATPMAHIARGSARRVAAEVAPFTASGAREIARQRVQGLAGGTDRAGELADAVGTSETGLSPARETGDPNMIGLEDLAASQDPNLREKLRTMDQAAQEAALARSRVGTTPEDARGPLEQRQRDFAASMRQRSEQALAQAQARIEAVQPRMSGGDNSSAVMAEIDDAYAAAKQTERELYGLIDKDAVVGVQNAREKAEEWASEFGWVGRGNMPAQARDALLSDNEVFTEDATVREMYNLYSDLRQTARNNRAGNVTNRRMAKAADEIADAILEDLGAVNGTTPLGQRINEARAHSAQMHQIFDQGTVGALRTDTVDGDTRVNPRLALETTVGRGGERAAVASDDLMRAGGENTPYAIEDFVRERFSDAVQDPQGAFTPNKARQFIRANRELLTKFPELRAELLGAAGQGDSAEAVQNRVAQVISQSRQAKFSALERFLSAPPTQAVNSVLSSPTPQRAARVIRNAASKDRSGQALDGLKATFSNEIIDRATRVVDGQRILDGDAILQALDDPKLGPAMKIVLDAPEITRMRRIANELVKAQARGANVGQSISGAAPNRLVEYAARIVAANNSGRVSGSGAGASLQAAQMSSSLTKDTLGRLFQDKAAQIISDAITDPDLFRDLLTDPGKIDLSKGIPPRFLPYLIGGASVAAQE